MQIIKAENLKHIYKTASGEKVALDEINFTIDNGEFVAIIGTNGSGKSTLAKHFNALLKPSAGLNTLAKINYGLRIFYNGNYKI